ncbi:hypothetical protein OGAPHI_005916 [Ogataea philodendri]|uniref:Glycosylphosphatidylinositol anchor biosynthesis protein 11 n=1 Tax=Ogataea philodendri TaxID=1378263 RepID=A0A9P8NXJ6_9ASCO|nr:uncharacterized protein OGAPHI_005916 [Ogataea philodendri]KAH3661738.1 hypothetical protein OGAPHI_005916 [Ogataea philodendri]
MPPKPKKIKKRVSFSKIDSFSDSKDKGTPSPDSRSVSPETAETSADEITDVFNVPKPRTSVLLIPFQLPLMGYALFHQFHINSQVLDGLLSSLISLAALQFVQGSILVKNVTRRKKISLFAFPNGGELMYLVISAFLTAVAALPIFVVLLVFGAPIGSLSLETFYLSGHLAFLTVFPLLATYKFTDSDAGSIWYNLVTFQVPNFYANQVYLQAVGAIVGCWLGVTPIPLDWDRDWQQWPITLVVGAYGGSFVAATISYLYNITVQ